MDNSHLSKYSFKGSAVNRTFHPNNGVSLEITSIVPLGLNSTVLNLTPALALCRSYAKLWGRKQSLINDLIDP